MINFGNTYQQPKMLFWFGQKDAWTGFWVPKTSLSKILFEKSKEPRCFAPAHVYFFPFSSAQVSASDAAEKEHHCREARRFCISRNVASS
jgi:hypothetical protein